MSRLDDFRGKDIVFVGLGRGRSAEGVKAYLEKYAGIASFSGVDGSSEPGARWKFLETYDQSRTIFIKNEGIPSRELTVPYTGTMQLFFELVKDTGAVTIGVTGTKGKSTTTALVAAMLESSDREVFLGGNIGQSVFHYLGQADPDKIFVIELSSYQLADVSSSPHISLCINLFHDHVDAHGSKAAYWEAKRNIMRFAGPEDYFVYNPSFEELKRWAAAAQCQTIAFDSTEAIDMSRSALIGEHNRLNAIAARTVAKLAGAKDAGVQAAIDNFQPLAHRLQTVAVKNGLTYIDDGIATTPEATIAAINAVVDRIGPIGCLMLGGEDRGYDFSELLVLVAKHRIPSLVLFPDTGEHIATQLLHQAKTLLTRDINEAVNFAAANSPKNSVVLLSTASPSYSIWPGGFEEKGDDFQKAVARLN